MKAQLFQAVALNFIQMLPAHMSLVATKSLAHYFLNQTNDENKSKSKNPWKD